MVIVLEARAVGWAGRDTQPVLEVTRKQGEERREEDTETKAWK